VASGNVEVFDDGVRLRASRITYDRTSDTLSVEGPIVLSRGEGDVLLADMAEISGDLREGLLRGARLVLGGRLQIASSAASRTSGRYTQLHRTIASSCRICSENQTPAWEIRAARTIHDEEARRIYFTDAQLRLFGVPVAWTPRLRIPDPSVSRAAGFLVPGVTVSDRLGTGVSLPYFVPLGDSADITLRPLLTSAGSTTLGLRYRHAFRRGSFEAEGAVTRDRLRAGTRAYVFAQGSYELGRGWTATGRAEIASDRAYLRDYGFSDRDRLESELRLARYRGRQMIDLGVIGFHSLRDTEDNQTVPWLQLDGMYRQRFAPLWGGQGGISLGVDGYLRNSTADVAVRDGARLWAEADWRRQWLVGPGFVLGAEGRIGAERIRILDDAAFPSPVDRRFGTAALDLSWPLERRGPDRRATLTPRAQLVWTGTNAALPPNEDSLLVEFDESNLFALDRFAGRDRIERGLRLNLGLAYTLQTDSGWDVEGSLGRVIRLRDEGQFGPGTGLDGQRSDYVATLSLGTPAGLQLFTRAVLAETGEPTRNETRLRYGTERFDLAASYLWLVRDPGQGRPLDTSGVVLDAGVMLARNWRSSLSLRHDLIAGSPVYTAIGLGYRNDCINVDLSLSRRFASSTIVTPSTQLSLSVSLAGIGGAGGMWSAANGCNG